jgi:hypothetical protein
MSDITEKYRKFLEEHFSRESINDQVYATRPLTIKTSGSFDFIRIQWEIDQNALLEGLRQKRNERR